MAAEMVVWKNLKRTFQEKPTLVNQMKPLQELEKSVTLIKNAMAELEKRKAMAALEEKKEVAEQEDDDSIDNKLRNLGAQLFQADDLVDEILTFLGASKITKKVSHFFSFHNPRTFPLTMNRKVRRTSQYIEKLAKQVVDVVEHIDHSDRKFEPFQGFKLAENTVIGRENDRENIIKMLLQPNTEGETNVSVIPIVGSPGLGKSTLAEYVYNDEKVRNHFDLKIWIRVSHLNEEEIVRDIVESCTNRTTNDNRLSRPANTSHSKFLDVLGCKSFDNFASPSNNSIGKNEVNISSNFSRNKDISERGLQREIKGKLFLLILDDAKIKRWQYLKDLLAKGARGSHIMVTTRFPEVANLSVADLPNTASVKPYELQGINEKDSWSLFETFAFEQKGHPRKPQLQRIGQSIAKNCKGVPLTIKVAASLLWGKSEEDWSSFNDRMLVVEGQGKDILKYVLHFSYTDLPTRLKACFNYCSLFPEDFQFKKHDLIHLWTAQGYIDQKRGQSFEEAAERYFLELSRRCFFEDASIDDLENIVTCKMHPIMRSLARKNTAGDVIKYGAGSSVNQVPDAACKHISFTCITDSSKIATSLTHTPNLRTLISAKEPDCDTQMDTSVCDTLFSSLTCLRVLDLNDLRIKKLPASIGKLIHLRYLDLSKNDLETLPESVTELYNLQTLKLNSCMRLRRLAGNFGQLINLKCFEIDECNSLTCMPLGLESLTQLERLSRFIVSKNSTELEALRNLSSLRGRLTVELSGEWATNIPEAPLAVMRSKINLEELDISWQNTVSEKEFYGQLLEQLQPNENLKILCIEGYRGGYFPSWAERGMLTCLPNLVVVSIEGCGECEHLPPFGKLLNLKRLTLRHMDNVQYVEPDSTADGSQESIPASSSFFPSLKELTLQNFYKLKGWKKEKMIASKKQEKIQSFPPLTKLRIWNCPNLRYMPLIENVLNLDLYNVDQMLLDEWAKKASSANQKHFKNDPKIEQLQIKGCHNLKSFEAVRKGLKGLPSLKQLVIQKCDALRSLTSELGHLNFLERLEISSCEDLDLSDEGISATVNTRSMLWISRRNSKTPSPWKSLEFLRHLTLGEIPKLETLPEGLQQVQSLRSLWISDCPALKELPEWISSLTALQNLRITSCPGVKQLPEGIKEVKSLVKFEVTGCPELMKRCKVHKGEDWDKIKHAWVLLHKSWRYGLMSEQVASQKSSSFRATNDVTYYIASVTTAEPIS